jgi:hypothetical protein
MTDNSMEKLAAKPADEDNVPDGTATVEYFVDDNGITYFVPRGPFTPVDIYRALERMYSDPELRRPVRVLWDMRGVDGRDLVRWGYDQMRNTASFAAENRSEGPGRAAFVVASEAVYGVCRMYEMTVDHEKLPVEHQVFREHAAAVDWLLRDF